MLTQIRIESFKLSRRLRSYIGFLGTAGITSLVALGMYYESPESWIDRMTGGQFMIVGNVDNASFLARYIMAPLFLFFMPLFASLIAGDIVAGEAAEGTLRTQLTRPVRRFSFILSKYLVSVLYAFVLTWFMGFFSYTLGAIIFGQGALLSIDPDHGISLFPTLEGVWRLFFGYTLAAAGMLAVTTIAFFLSTLVSNSLGPVGISMMLLITCSIMGEIPYFDWLRPYLFTTHMQVFREAFRVPIQFGDIGRSLLTLGVYVVVFLTGAIIVFKRKDVLT